VNNFYYVNVLRSVKVYRSKGKGQRKKAKIIYKQVRKAIHLTGSKENWPKQMLSRIV